MTPDIIYHLNADDEIVFVNDAWSAFADANQGEAVRPPMVLRRRVWDFIVDAPTRHIYSVLYERVRVRAESVRLTFRCDAPATRRLLELELTPQETGGIVCRVRQLSEEDRDPMPVLDATRARGQEMVLMCSWCKRVAMPTGTWLHLEEAVSRFRLFTDRLPPDLSHGICPGCLVALEALIQEDPKPRRVAYAPPSP